MLEKKGECLETTPTCLFEAFWFKLLLADIALRGSIRVWCQSFATAINLRTLTRSSNFTVLLSNSFFFQKKKTFHYRPKERLLQLLLSPPYTERRCWFFLTPTINRNCSKLSKWKFFSAGFGAFFRCLSPFLNNAKVGEEVSNEKILVHSLPGPDFDYKTFANLRRWTCELQNETRCVGKRKMQKLYPRFVP